MEFVTVFLVIVIVMAVLLGVDSYLILLERKVAARVQDRYGPNRVGPAGLLQPIADGLKFLFKEQVIPAHVDKVLYLLAPALATVTAMLAFAVVPFGDTSLGRYAIAPGVDIGILFVFAVGSLNVYAVIVGGWASNNKYSLFGGLRSSAQLISYEIPLGLSVLGIIMLTGSLNLEQVITVQAAKGLSGWNIWIQPLAGILFFASALAECNRLPFDLPECEQELVGGYHTEYSAMKFVMFFIGEYTHVITISFLLAILFFGGWHLPWIAEEGQAYPGVGAVKAAVLVGKVVLFIVLIMLLRWTLPRFRYDQLMNLAWKVFIPLALLNVVLVMIIEELGASRWWLFLGSVALLFGAAAVGAVWPKGQPRGISLAARLAER